MKIFRGLSINVKMSLIVGFVMMVAVCTILIISQRRDVLDTETSALLPSAAHAAADLAEYINAARVMPRTFAKTAATVIRDNEIPEEAKRQKPLDEFDELQFLADADRKIDNLWAGFDRNAVYFLTHNKI